MYYSPSEEPATERLILIQLSARDSDNHYRHLNARIVRFAEREHINPDTGQTVWGDGRDATGYRNCTWSTSKNNAVYVEDFAINCQMTIRELDGSPGEQRVYGTDMEFSDVYRVKRAAASQMVRTFRKVDNGLANMQETLGYLADDDYADHCLRVAAVLRITKFLFARPGRDSSSLAGADNFIVMRASGVHGYVNDLIKRAYS